MSLNIGNSKYVYVKNPTMKLDFSENVVFADLTTSRKTTKIKKDSATGNEIVNSDTGEPVYEKHYSNWEGRFIGNALESAKALVTGDVIDIINGWVETEFDKEKGKLYINVIITEFRLVE